MDQRLFGLIDKCEVMSLITIKASYHWSFLSFILSIPIIFINSILCILNSLSDQKIPLKIPNIIINGISVLFMSITTSLKSAEKKELFKSLSNNFLLLTHEIEGCEMETLSRESVNVFVDKYDSLIQQVPFEEIPTRIKREVVLLCEGKKLPTQLNGGSVLAGFKQQRNRLMTTIIQDESVHP